MELGILSLGDLQRDQRTGRRNRPVDRMAEVLGYAVLADQLGLDVFAVGEHHSEEFFTSSPAVVLDAAAVVPRAVQDRLPVWVGVGGSPDSAERAGRLGLPMVLGYIGGTLAHLRPLVDAYRAAGERAGHAGALKVAISTHFHAGADPTRARAVYPYYQEYLRPKRPGGRGFAVSQAGFDAGTGRQGAIMIGSAEEITDKLLDAVKALCLDRIFAQVDWGGLPSALVEESIARYATDIAPALRAA